MSNPAASTTAAFASSSSSSPSPPSSSFPDQLSFLSTICGTLKLIKRTGWVRSGVPLPESDADHMHRCAMSAMLVTQPPHPSDIDLYEQNGGEDFGRFDCRKGGVDATKLCRMALTHDLCESLAGDVTPHCREDLVKSKEANEESAMAEIRKVVGDPLGEELYGLWREYEDQVTTEAIYCKDIDKFEMVCQAYEYERDHLGHKEGKGGGGGENGDGSDVTGEKGRGDGDEDEEDDKAGGKAETNGGSIGAEDCATRSAKKPRAAPSASAAQESAPPGNDHLPPKSTEPDGALSAPLRTFFVSTRSVLRTPLFRRLDGEVRSRRETMLRERGWSVSEEERQGYDN